ncbi:aminotransferase class I/II-fold pyridoxal phosphate-dependent enzyme [Actinoalloteichus caeruleus]|uniref:aminotransferase class I/II-fold pyridoxal phosphate-dependent enzyme n=1 Tax=Actinoalloteichus cyanogriseus TaxID=2893586 RepID=UPI0004AB0A2A|nr:aminotransferase class I/II-fold pyridoxal phosphate-dependent enzyme [Actinoalloteichus caeruleus]
MIEVGNVFGWLATKAAARERAGLRRLLRARDGAEAVLDLAGNDYLGLSRHPAVIEAAEAALRRWGAGSTGSRLVTGSTTAHAALEEEIADFCGAEAAVVLSSGYLANLAALTALATPNTRVVVDAYNHASLVDGARLARGRTVPFAHADVAAAEEALATNPSRRALVVTDSVFSVDGDLTDLGALAASCSRFGAALLVDDAHGLGVVGPGGQGAVAAAGLAGRPDVVVTATLSKALGGQGGVVLGSRTVVRHLVETARPFLFDTALAPASAAAALAALRVLRAEPGLAARVRLRSAELSRGLVAAGLPASTPAGAVVSVRAPGPRAAAAWAERCREAGVAVGCFRPPSAPDGGSRLRLGARADLTPEDVRRAVAAVRAAALDVPEG